MKIKKLFITLLLINVAFCYASMAVTDYANASDLNSTYVTNPSGLSVYESPSKNSRKIIHLPPDSQVLVLSLNGPESTFINSWNNEAFDSNWAAILLPPDLRKNGNLIGWIESADYMWWSPLDEFSTDKWTAETLEGYLKNSVWYVTNISNDGKTITGICAFDRGSFTIYYYDDEKHESEKNTYSIFSPQSIKLNDDDDVLDLNINRNFFSFTYSGELYDFKKINLGSLEFIPEYRDNSQKRDEVRHLLYKLSKKYFRMYSADYYNQCNIMDLSAKQEDMGLKLLAITYGVKIDSDNSLMECPEFGKYWEPLIKDCEASVKKRKYTFKKNIQSPLYLVKGYSYVTSDNLRLRKSEDTSSEIITTMEKGSEVIILDFGKMDLIDGLPGCWVSVQVKGTEDKGWCFGGYLKEKNKK